MAGFKKGTSEYFLEITGEISDGQGEDFCVAEFLSDGCALAVFDGCGGIGAERYGGPFKNHTGAYAASRTAGNAFSGWYTKTFALRDWKISFESLPLLCNEVHMVLQEQINRMGELARANAQTGLIKGSMHKLLPTTASIMISQYARKAVNMCFLWAGDSRGYVLNKKGLMQITQDDSAEEIDAWDSLFNDQPLTNMITAFNDFDLNACFMSCELPVAAIVATDGCFDYLPTPMHLEHMLLSELKKAVDFEDWKNRINDRIREVSADDYSMEIGLFGFRSFQDVQSYFRSRANNLESTLEVLDVLPAKYAKEEWDSYKRNYYRDEP